MSSLHALHRRRSHSTSSHTPKARRTPDVSWRAATKRAHAQHSFGPGLDLSSPQKWDVDVWRRGKRARRDLSHSLEDVYGHGPPDSRRSSSRSAPPTPALATTSAEFQFFPQSDPSPNMTANVVEDESDLTQLRSDAFCELRRSVAENGEGLVLRMRDYEDSRSRSKMYSKAKEAQRRGRKQKSLSVRPKKPVDQTDRSDAEEDVQIFAGVQSGNKSFTASRKQRAQSLGMMDLDSDISGLDGSERCYSPGATCDSFHSTYPSDDEDNQRKGAQFPSSSFSPCMSTAPNIAFTPALSHTYSNSANSSLVSLPLPPPVSLSHPSSDPYSSMFQFTPRRHSHLVPLSASRSERAIAALTLAMANGAGGLNDYEAIRAIQAPPVLEDCQVGELWH